MKIIDTSTAASINPTTHSAVDENDHSYTAARLLHHD
jgi:hypothetical protein